MPTVTAKSRRSGQDLRKVFGMTAKKRKVYKKPEPPSFVEKQYKAKKHMPKRNVQKLEAGTWLQVKWLGSPDTVALLLEKPQRGDQELRIWDACPPNNRTQGASWYIGFEQVVAVLGKVTLPRPLPQAFAEFVN